MDKKMGKILVYMYTLISLLGSVLLFLINYKCIALILFIQYFMVLMFINSIKNKKKLQLLLSLFLMSIIFIIISIYYYPLNLYNLITNYGRYSLNNVTTSIYMITTLLICVISLPIVLIRLTYFILAATSFNNEIYLNALFNNKLGSFISTIDPFFKIDKIKFKRLIINIFVNVVFLIVIVFLLKVSLEYLKIL